MNQPKRENLPAATVARQLTINLREALTYPLALERAVLAASEEDRAAVRRLLLRAYEERGPRVTG